MRFFQKGSGFFPSSKRTRTVTRLVSAALALLMLSGIGFGQAKDVTASHVVISADGANWEFTTHKKTVGEALTEAGVQFGNLDVVSPAKSTAITDGAKIRVCRVTQKIVTQKESLAFKTITRYKASVQNGRVVDRSGVLGEREVRYLLTHRDGVLASSKAVGAKVTRKPVAEIVSVSVSRGGGLASRAGSYSRSLTMLATGYEPNCRGSRSSGRTANGMHAGFGVVAVDPRVIRLGTRLYVEGYGVCVAGDTGGSIRGARIDLGFSSRREALRFGRRRVAVHILE